MVGAQPTDTTSKNSFSRRCNAPETVEVGGVKIAITKEVADQLPQQVDGKAAAH
jgi:hypothetical protein